MKVCVFVFSAGLFFAAMAAQNVGNVTVSRDAGRRLMTVSYTLAEPGIVTVAFKRDGVAIPEARFANVAGDVNKYVAATGDGESRTIRWQTDIDWPETAFDGDVTAEVSAWTTNNPPDYVVLDLATMTNSAPYVGARYYTSTNALPGGLFDERYFTSKIVMRKIPAAGVVWKMGSEETEVGRQTNTTYGVTEDRHKVRLTSDYYIGVFETTWGQSPYMFNGTSYQSITNSQTVKDVRCPQNMVAYYTLRRPGDASNNYPYDIDKGEETWLAIGNLRCRTGVKFNLPTEAMWEYACRAGTGTAFSGGFNLANNYWGKMNPASVRALGWIYYSSTDEEGNAYTVHPVGLKIPNPWGLYDMYGNVGEWCYDFFAAYDTSSDVLVNPTGPKAPIATGDISKPGHVIRGGTASSGASDCRSAARGSDGGAGMYWSRGFRLVCPVTLY